MVCSRRTGKSPSWLELEVTDSTEPFSLRPSGCTCKCNVPGPQFMDSSLLLPYFKPSDIPFQTPSGSSSGSCAGVAAGFAPITFGAETDGSAVQPASRAAVFALKVTPALAGNSGTQPGNSDFDSLGVMSKSVTDILNPWERSGSWASSQLKSRGAT